MQLIVEHVMIYTNGEEYRDQISSREITEEEYSPLLFKFMHAEQGFGYCGYLWQYVRVNTEEKALHLGGIISNGK